MANDVTECSDYLLNDIRTFWGKKRTKDAEQNKLQEQLNKDLTQLKRQFASVQNKTESLRTGIDALKSSAPSNEMLREFCDENAKDSVDAVTLKEDFEQCIMPDKNLHKQDYAMVKSILADLKKITNC